MNDCKRISYLKKKNLKTMSGKGDCHRHYGCSFLLIFVSAVFLLSGIGSSCCCFGAKTNDEIILPIEIWDVDGKRMEETNLYQRPRFVITAVIGGQTGTVQPSTFDLGNPNQMILVAQYCQSCSNDNNNNNNNDNGNNGCPLPVPMECQNDNRMTTTTTIRSQNPLRQRSISQTQTCAPSWPHGFVPASDLTFPTNEEEKEFVSFTHIHSDASLKEPSSAGKMKYPPNQSPERDVSMQCFNNATHSRYTISATLNTLSFFDPKVTLHDQSQPTTKTLSSVPTTTYHTMKNVKIGAMVRTVPQIDRVWSNIGIGYHSQFLNQIQSRAVLILPDNKTSPTNKGSTIVFNAKKERYSHWSSTYFPVMLHRRVHSNVDIRIASSPPSSSSTKKDDSRNPLKNDFFPNEGYRKAFHIDTGNDGIALQSTRIQHNLAKSTGGLWISKLDLLDMFPTFALDDRFFHDDEHTMKFLVVPTAFAQHDKHTANDDDTSKTDLIVELSSTVHVRIPTNRWILPPAKSDNEEPQLFVPTIFFTYAKNVLGLPFILATEGMAYDDENHSIHIQKNDYQQLS